MNLKRLVLGSWSTTALACLGVALPKCPLCLAAYLCLFGFSAGSARALASLGLPLCLTLIGLGACATALLVARRSAANGAPKGGAPRSPPQCCAPRGPQLDAEG